MATLEWLKNGEISGFFLTRHLETGYVLLYRDDLSRCQMYIELLIVCVCYLCQQFNCDFSCDVAVVVSMLFRLFQASVVS